MPALLPPCVEATVDRIEAGWAIVEWCGATVADVPIIALPPDTREGDTVTFHFSRRSARRLRAGRPVFKFRNGSGHHQEESHG